VPPDLRSAFLRLPGYPLAGIPEMRRRLEREGVDVIDLGAGDADLAPPSAVVDRMRGAVADPAYGRYAFQLGLPDFRSAAATWMKERFQVELDPFSELLPLIGSKDGIAHLPLAYLEPGDIGIMPDPGYQAYQGGTLLAGGEPYKVVLSPESDFLIRFESLPPEVVSRARLLYLNYPNNPTTATAPLEYLEEAIAFCRESDILLVHDHAYSEIAFDGYRPPSILELSGARDVAIEFHSLSKTYNMTGWRLGWAAGNADVVAALSKVKTFVDTGVFLAVQAAGVAALDSWATWVPQNVARFAERRDRAVAALRRAGFQLSLPVATMYLWVPVPGSESSFEFARRAIEEQGVVILPGSALGAGGEGFFRIALTVESERLEEGAARLGRIL
jgi:LL-diaminopimelate aminotransferase